MEYDGDYFDGVYAEGGGDPWGYFESEYERRKFERTLAAVRDRRADAAVGRVLDVGCGNGAKTSRVADAYPDADVLGVDLSGEALATARERAPAATYERRDVLEFVTETDRTFDVVLAVESLGYLCADHGVTRLVEFADQLAAVLADDGLLVATHLHMPRGEGPLFGQARSAGVLRGVLATAFEMVGRRRYDAVKRTALAPDEAPEQPYEVWAMAPGLSAARGRS